MDKANQGKGSNTKKRKFAILVWIVTYLESMFNFLKCLGLVLGQSLEP